MVLQTSGDYPLVEHVSKLTIILTWTPVVCKNNIFSVWHSTGVLFTNIKAFDRVPAETSSFVVSDRCRQQHYRYKQQTALVLKKQSRIRNYTSLRSRVKRNFPSSWKQAVSNSRITINFTQTSTSELFITVY